MVLLSYLFLLSQWSSAPFVLMTAKAWKNEFENQYFAKGVRHR